MWKNYLRIIIYKIIYMNYVYEQFFLHFFKLVFFYNNVKIIPLIIFCFHITIIISIILKINFTKKRCINMYGHISYIITRSWIFIHVYACLYIYLYIFMKNLLPERIRRFYKNILTCFYIKYIFASIRTFVYDDSNTH